MARLNSTRKSYPNRIGLIILAHDSVPYVARAAGAGDSYGWVSIDVFSLRDFAMVASRFDTAGDLITFLEMRGDIAAKVLFSVQDEARNIEHMLPHVEDVLERHMSATSPEVMQKTVKAFGEVATGRLLESAEWRYGLSIDDMIARVHDVDPELAWNKGDGRGGLEVARFLGWLTRDRRIKLGEKNSRCVRSGPGRKTALFPPCAAFTRNGGRFSNNLAESSGPCGHS